MCIAVYTLVHIHTSVNCLVCSSLQLSEQLGNLVFGSSDGKFLFFISTSASKQLGILSLKESHLCMMGCQSCVSACSLLSSNKGTNKQYRSQLLSHSLQYRYIYMFPLLGHSCLPCKLYWEDQPLVTLWTKCIFSGSAGCIICTDGNSNHPHCLIYHQLPHISPTTLEKSCGFQECWQLSYWCSR